MGRATTSISRVAPASPAFALDRDVSVLDIADAARNALLVFAWRANRWNKRELAEWLTGDYERALSAVAARVPPASGIHRTAGAIAPIADSSIATLVRSAHAEALDHLRRAWAWRYDERLARDLFARGLVVRVTDASGRVGFAPVGAPGVRLVDRVRALAVADYLTRPEAYESFGVCPDCSAATFDYAAHTNDCAGLRRTLRGLGAEVVSADCGIDVDIEIEVDVDDELEIECVVEEPIEPDVVVEVLGEIEIEIDMSGIEDNDVDAFGDLRDTLVDPIELAGASDSDLILMQSS